MNEDEIAILSGNNTEEITRILENFLKVVSFIYLFHI